MNKRTNKPHINMAYSLDRGRRSPYRQDRYTFHRGRPPMSGPGQPGVNVVGHGRHPMMSAGNVYAQQPRPGMSPQGNMMMTPPSGMMSMPVPMQQQPAGFNQQQMMPGQMQPGQMPPQGYYIQQPNQPMPQFQPPPYSQVAPYGQQNFNMPINQMPMQMQPQNMTEEQKKEFEKRKKEMYFHEQQLKLKALSQQGSVGGWGTSNLSSLENMMGMFGSGKNKKTMSGPSMNASKSSVPSKQEMPTPTASAATPQADDDGFGDFMAGPTATSSQNTAMSAFQSAPAPSAGHTNISTDTTQVPLPTPASQPSPKVEEKQDLESLMLESITDMSAPQKAKKTFKQKTALKDTQGQTKTQTTAFSESSKARKWDNTEDLSDMFIVPTPAPPQPPEEAPTPAAQNTLPLSVNTTGPAAMQGQITPPSPAALSSSGQGSPSTYTPPAWCRNEANLPMVYRHVLEATIRNGVIDTELLYPILVLSGLDRAVLGHVWGLCNRTTLGVLTKDEMYMSLALIAIAQSGQTQNLTIEALYNMPHPPAPTLTPPGTASPNTPVSVPSSSGTVTPATPTAVTPMEAPPAADDDFAPFQEAPPQPQATGCMYPPLSSEDEYADFKSGDSSSSSSMSSSRASSQTSSSQNTDPEFPGFPRVGQPDVFPDLPTSGSSSPSSIRYPGILGGKALKLSRESPTFEHRKYSSRQSSKQSLEGNLPPVRAPGLTPSKFGPVRDSEDDEFADFQQASSSGQQFSGLREPSKISAPPTFQAKFPIATPVSQQDEEFADFQTAEQPKETSEDLFKFDEEDKYAALRSLSLDVQDTESVNEFADFKKSDEQDEFADFKKSNDQDKFADFKQSNDQDEFADFKTSDNQDEFADFKNAGGDSFSDFQQSSSTSHDQFADFGKQQPSNVSATQLFASTAHLGQQAESAEDEFSDFQQGGKHSTIESSLQNVDEEETQYRGGMAGGFFDSDRTEETADSETKEPTKKSDTNIKFVPRRISSYDDEDDLFGRKPPAMTDFDDDEFGDFDSAPPISHDIDDDLFTSAIKPKPKPEKSFDMFGGQKFKGKANPVQSVQEQESEKSSDINTADNVSSKSKTHDKYDAFKELAGPSEANPPAIENLEFNKSEETSDKYGVFKGLTEQKPATAALEDKYNIFRELEQSSEKLPEDKNMFGEVRPGKSTTPEIEIQENKGLIKGDNSLPTQSRNNLDNRTKKEKDLFSSGSRYQIGGDDDLFGNLGPNPPGYSPPGNISNDNFSDFSSSVASKTPDSISINSKESDSSGFDGSGIKKGLPKLESFASLDLKSFDTTPSGDDEDAGDSYGYTAPTDSTTNTIDSQPTKALDKRSGALVISTGPPPVPSISTGPPLPLFGDRYGGVVGDIEDNERHTYEWQRCLQSCYNTLRKANETFNAVSSSSVCTEVISSEEGSSYLQALIEIYRVSCRVGTAMKASGLETDELLDLLRNTNLLWNNLAAFLAGSPLMPDDSLFVFSGAVLKADPSNADRACGVCLLNVDSRSKAFDRSVDSHKLTYGGRQYHSMCANLWVNLVDSILPALPLPSLLL